MMGERVERLGLALLRRARRGNEIDALDGRLLDLGVGQLSPCARRGAAARAAGCAPAARRAGIAIGFARKGLDLRRLDIPRRQKAFSGV